MTLNGGMALLCVISPNSVTFGAPDVKVVKVAINRFSPEKCKHDRQTRFALRGSGAIFVA